MRVEMDFSVEYGSFTYLDKRSVIMIAITTTTYLVRALDSYLVTRTLKKFIAPFDRVKTQKNGEMVERILAVGHEDARNGISAIAHIVFQPDMHT